MAWPGRKGFKIRGLDLQKTHLLEVIGPHGKPIESVRFRFSSYKSIHLCMTYDGYGGIGLKQQDRHTPWCNCK